MHAMDCILSAALTLHLLQYPFGIAFGRDLLSRFDLTEKWKDSILDYVSVKSSSPESKPTLPITLHGTICKFP
jgi:hypothetical protein